MPKKNHSPSGDAEKGLSLFKYRCPVNYKFFLVKGCKKGHQNEQQMMQYDTPSDDSSDHESSNNGAEEQTSTCGITDGIILFLYKYYRLTKLYKRNHIGILYKKTT